ncbi:NAD(P)/FAD-dependent oxidoreductase, partial [Halobium palmae]
GATSAFHEGGDHLAVRTGAIAGELAASGDLSAYNRRWKEATGDEILRNVSFADVVRDYGPDDWDRTFKHVNTLMADEGEDRLIDTRKAVAGLGAAKLALAYKRRKRKFGKGKYVQLTEDEYAL